MTQYPLAQLTQLAEATSSTRPVSLPTGLPTFRRISEKPIINLLDRFEDRLEAHRYPKNRYVLALIACSEKARLTGSIRVQRPAMAASTSKISTPFSNKQCVGLAPQSLRTH
jgi:hypothetical protein